MGANDTAAEIRSLREVLGMTQEQLARAIGVSYSTVSRWETGRGRPSPLAVQRLRELRERLRSTDDSKERTKP